MFNINFAREREWKVINSIHFRTILNIMLTITYILMFLNLTYHCVIHIIRSILNQDTLYIASSSACNFTFSSTRELYALPCMEKMWNLGFSFPGIFAFGGKSLQFWGEIHHLDGYFGLFLPNISENL